MPIISFPLLMIIFFYISPLFFPNFLSVNISPRYTRIENRLKNVEIVRDTRIILLLMLSNITMNGTTHISNYHNNIIYITNNNNWINNNKSLNKRDTLKLIY